MFIKIFLFLILAHQNDAYKFLIVSPTPFKSHWIIGSSIAKELAKVGHDVTFISPFELKFNKVENIVLTRDMQAYSNAFDLRFNGPLNNIRLLPEFVEQDVKFTLSHPKFQQVLTRKEKFDAVIVEIFLTDALFGLGVHFNYPLIGFTTFGASMWTNIITATPNPSSYIPNPFTSLKTEMSFSERFYNSIVWSVEEICWHLIHFPKQQRLYEKFFPNAPPLMDVIKNMSLILNNNHFTTTSIKPAMPNVIDVGGIYVEHKPKALPEIFQSYLDNAREGAILFSMGSIIQAVDWPIEKREAITRAFGRLKQKVIWKYENETLPNKPDNVMISAWLPQRDILAHPNLKLFISHGGLLSTTEAIMEAVPILSIPIFGDQKLNMRAAEAKGFGKVLDFNEISEENFYTSIQNALNDETLNLKVREISKLYKDRPMSPQRSAVYWIEYVIRHNGAHHLKSSGLKLNYIELHNIDVLLAMICLMIFFLYIARFLIKFFLMKLTRKNKKEKIR